ncbi:MAG TPA: branched-chain amino acid ABC transporter permease [Ilumatobacteraceae bacterium]|nr:branched-chain amino acid ABC transporter permease [Ilumatobacteraceae bacterium]
MTTQSVAIPKVRRPWMPSRTVLGVLAMVVIGYVVLAIPSGALATEQFVNALTIGALYALIALGYTMVYGIIELINFAHGEIFMSGSFVALIAMKSLGLTDTIHDPVLLIGALAVIFVISMLAMGVLGVVIERFAYRPLRNAPRLAPLITAIGVSFILQNIVFVGYSNSVVTTPKLIPFEEIQIGPFSVRMVNLFVIVLALGLMAALHLFTTRTQLGTAMRSTAMDREAAQLMGVDINRAIAITFFIGAALAGAAGVVQTQYLGSTVFNIGFRAGLFAFTAAVLGGIGNIAGAALGGFVIGFLEVASSAYGYGRWSEAVVFTTLILVLIFRPNGLLGQQTAERA